MNRRFTVELCNSDEEAWCRWAVSSFHYLHKPPDPRSRPLAYIVRVDGERAGCLYFGRPESTCCYQGHLTYGGAAEIESGRAKFDRWEVLNLARVWLSPEVQRGGRLCRPDVLPGFTDRKGEFRSMLASAVIHAALARVGCDYLLAHPPCFVDQPYRIEVVLSYCDTKLHLGTIYRAAGFRFARVNDEGIETWFTEAVGGLTGQQDEAVRRASAVSARSRRIRGRAEQRSLFGG